jgi:hypothetical protein
MRANLLFLLIALVLSGCTTGGLHFSEVALNEPLPDDFKKRVLWTSTDVFKYNLDQLVGHMIYEQAENPGKFERGPRYVDPDKPPVFKTIDGGIVYHSKVDRAAAAEGSYLVFAASIGGSNTVDVTIADTAQVFLPYERIPIAELVKESKKAPEKPATKRYYIQGVLLATVTRQAGSAIEANASGVVGDAYKAKGTVYHKASQVIRDVRISLLTIDIDRLAILGAGRNLEGQNAEALLKASRAEGFLVKELAGIEANKAD